MKSIQFNHERLHWPVERIRAYQLDRLRDTLVRAACAPYYGPRLAGRHVESLEDLVHLPLTSKEDARAASPFGLLAVEPEELSHYAESFGTTGKPTSSWLTRGDLRNYATQMMQTPLTLGPGDRMMVRFPYAVAAVAHGLTQAARDRGACVIPVSIQTEVTPYPRVVEILGKVRTTVLACLPTEAIRLAEAVRLAGRDPARDFPHLRAIQTAGELLSDVRRARIAELWQVPVYNMYGCTEAGNIAADCPAGRLHLSWDHFLLEVLDEYTCQPVLPGKRGVAVLTTLTRQAQPLVRFALGDYVRLLHEPRCPCGRTAPVLDHYGRDANRFEFRGRKIFIRELEDRLLTAPTAVLGNLWLVEVRPDEVRFRVEAERFDPAMYRQLEEKVRADLDLPLVIDAVAPGGLLSRDRLTRVEPVGKPRAVGYVIEPSAPALTLDDLMEDL